MEVDEKIDGYGCTSLPQTVTQGLNCGQSAVTVYHGGLIGCWGGEDESKRDTEND